MHYIKMQFLLYERPPAVGSVVPQTIYTDRGFAHGPHWGTVPRSPVCGVQKIP